MPVVIFISCLPSSPEGYAGHVILGKNLHQWMATINNPSKFFHKEFMMLSNANLVRSYTIFLNGISSLISYTLPISDILTVTDISSYIF